MLLAAFSPRPRKSRMSALRHSLLFLLAWLTLTGCDSDALRPKSGGRPFEVLVAGDADSMLVRSLIQSTPGLPQPEPQFDVSTTTRLDAVSRVARAIVVLTVDSTAYPAVQLSYDRDRYAAPQLIIRVGTPSRQALRRYLERQPHHINDLLLAHEMSAHQNLLRKKHNAEAAQLIRQQFAVDMLIPEDLIATKQGRDFLWLSDNGGASNRSICLYHIPRSTRDIDSVLRTNIPGEYPGTYVETVCPSIRWQQTTLNHAAVPIARGLWQMHGYAMGGPFVAYFFDQGPSWLVVQAFVYAPADKKRNRLRLLEAALQTSAPIPHK